MVWPVAPGIRLFSPIYFIVTADIDGDDLPILQNQLQRYPVADVDGYRMKFAQGAFEPVQSKRGMKGVDFQELEGLFVLGKKIGMFFEKAGSLPVVAGGVDDPKTHGSSFWMRARCSSTLSSIPLPSAISRLAW